MHLEKQIATIFPLTQQLPPTKKNKREPFASQKKTNKHISFRVFFFQETPFESFFWQFFWFRITSLQVIAGDASLIFSGKSSPQATTDPWDW